MRNTDTHTNSEIVIFIHIPKAAGTTFYKVLDRQYKPRQILYIEHGLAKQGSIDAFRQLADDRKSYLRCIRGHMPFGLHKWLSQPVTYITILRNPVERVISYYHYVRSTPNHRFYSEVIQKNMSLEDFVRKIMDINENNLQVRWISGCVDFDSVMPPYDDLPSNALDLAKENIESCFTVCGLTERFNESLLLMQKILGWKCVVYMRRNVGKRRRPKRELPSSTIRLIEKNEEQDLALYEFANRRLSEMLDVHGIGDDQVREFQSMNRLLGTPICVYELIGRKMATRVLSAFRIGQRGFNFGNKAMEETC